MKPRIGLDAVSERSAFHSGSAIWLTKST